MSRRKAKKSDMDDLDDVLGDLLGDDDDPPPKKTPAKGRGAAAAKKGPGVFDDEFYAQLAADADSQSDVSDADPGEIAKSLADLDDMDSALFGPGKARASTPKSPDSRTKTTPAKPPVDFDEDDPLAGLLSDDEDTKPKAKPAARSKVKEEVKVEVKTSPNEDDSISSGSRRLEIQRPPTRSGTQEKRRGRQDDISFDDDDVLGGMGLESPGRKAAAAAKQMQQEDDSSSFLASLGIGKAADKPGSASSRPETFFDRMEKKAAAASGKPSKEVKEEDIAFGGYMPSATTGGGSRPSSHRSVRFENDEERPGSRGNTPGGRRRGTYLDDMLSKDETDWLDMAAGGSSNKPERPASEGTSRTTREEKKAEPVDWLGLSRLGSPEVKPQAKLQEERTATPDKPLKSALKSPGTGETPQKEEPVKPTLGRSKSTDDWLGLGDSVESDKEDDWLGSKKPADDWLAPKDPPKPKETTKVEEKKQDKPARSQQEAKPDDWLGGGGTDESIFNKPVSAAAKTESHSTNILSTPSQPSSDTASLDLSGPRVGRRAARTSPASAGPQTESLFATPVADDTDDLSATLQALKSERAGRAATATQPSSAFTPPVAPLSVDNTFQRQQQLIQQQQQQQQAQLQQQMEAQLMQVRKQQEDQMKLWQQQQQQMMQQFSNPLQEYQTMLLRQQQQQQQLNAMKTSFGLGMSGFGMPGMEDLESKVRRLEFEKQHMEMMFESAKSQHTQEVQLIQTSYTKRIELLEETFAKRETRLREENDLLGQQWMGKLQQLEQEKSDILASSMRRHEEWDKAKQDEISRLREQHREDVSKLRQEHEEALNRLRSAKDLEIEAISSSQSHAKSLQLIMEQISTNARDLSDLHKAVEGHNQSTLEERETSVKTRDQQLKSLQERLERQHHENEMERARLQGLITKLEHQLTEQTRITEEEKWTLAQEKNRMSTLQASLERERNSIQDQLKRERQELQQARETLLEEQRSILGQLHEERRVLAEEKAHFNINQKLKIDKDQHDSMNQVKTEAELQSSIRLLGEKRQQLQQQEEVMKRERQQLEDDRSRLQQERAALERERDRLQQTVIHINQMSQDIEESVKEACRARDEGTTAMGKARQMEVEQSHRLHNIQLQLQALRDKEKSMAQEKLNMAREKQNLEQSWNTVLCVNCRTPIRDPGPAAVSLPTTATNTAVQIRMSSAASNLYNSLDPDLRSKVDSLSDIAKSIQVDRSVRMWKIAAEKDKEYLKEESVFLEALRHTPYH